MEYDLMAHNGLLVESQMGDTCDEMSTITLLYSASHGHLEDIEDIEALLSGVEYSTFAAGEFIIIRTNPHPSCPTIDGPMSIYPKHASHSRLVLSIVRTCLQCNKHWLVEPESTLQSRPSKEPWEILRVI